jgi:hypothetical protein
VGDFNGDGFLDLAVVNAGAVSILLGNGDGTFQPPVSLPVAGNHLVVGDFESDGIPDLAVGNESGNTVSVLLGNGDGTFRRAGNFLTGSGPFASALGDFNGDGLLDLAVADRGSNDVSILLNDGVWPPSPGGSPRGKPPASPGMGRASADRVPAVMGDGFRMAPSADPALSGSGVSIYDMDPALAWLQLAGHRTLTDDYFTCAANRTPSDCVALSDATTVTGKGGDTMSGNGALALIDTDGQDNITGFNPNSISGGLHP